MKSAIFLDLRKLKDSSSKSIFAASASLFSRADSLRYCDIVKYEAGNMMILDFDLRSFLASLSPDDDVCLDFQLDTAASDFISSLNEFLSFYSDMFDPE